MARLTMNTAAWQEPGRRWPCYRGRQCWQFLSDMDRYREVVEELRPPFVIEVGRAEGGTALWLADAVAAHDGLVISIDVREVPDGVAHPHLVCIVASSTHPATLERVAQWIDGERAVVLLDGDHDQFQVEDELGAYAPLADYLVVEDTIMADLPDMERNGPHQALWRWWPGHPEFRPDPDPTPTQHPGGWLRRVAEET